MVLNCLSLRGEQGLPSRLSGRSQVGKFVSPFALSPQLSANSTYPLLRLKAGAKELSGLPSSLYPQVQ